MKICSIYKSEKDKDGNGFVQVQFDNLTKEENNQIEQMFSYDEDSDRLTGIWLCVGQFYNEDNMLDCIQVYCDQWESNCDTTFTDYKEDFIKELQDLMAKVLNTEDTESLIGTSINLEVAA